MRSSTALGALLGAAALAAGALAFAKKPPRPEEPFFVYTVQAGDTLSALALTFFGDSAKWPLLHDAMDHGDKGPAGAWMEGAAVPVGAKIRIPCAWETVLPGDTLSSLAKRALGDAGRWRRIYEANRKALPDPNKLGVGQRLAVPLEVAPRPAPPVISVGCVGCDLDMLGAEGPG